MPFDPYIVNSKASIFCTCRALRVRAQLARTQEAKDAYLQSLATVLDNFGIHSGHEDYFLLRHGS
jgi:hypothetical protein